MELSCGFYSSYYGYVLRTKGRATYRGKAKGRTHLRRRSQFSDAAKNEGLPLALKRGQQ